MPKRFLPALLLAFLIAAPFCVAQDSPAADPASDPPAAAPSSGSAESLQSNPRPAAPPSEWQILGSQWKRTAPDLLRQQKEIWLFPLSVARGRHWKPTLAVIGATALLTTIDAHNARWVRNNTQPLSGFNNAFSGFNTATATEAFASAFYIVAIARHNAYDQQTFILAGEAVLDSEILTTVMKDIDRREAPISYPPGGSFTDSWFKVRHGGLLSGLGSMPSGHEIAAMSVATIFAERYPHPAWHRWLAYGLASLVGVSRVTLQAHFTSDTFAGAALGYVISRYVVLGRPPI